MLYDAIFRHLLRRLSPERAHELAVAGVRVLSSIPGALALLRRLTRPAPELAVHAFGRTFPSPLGVAAGLDKGATWFEFLGALGFGFVEVGTVTPVGQPGNPRPRIHRLIEDRALINSMGFPNPGVGAVKPRLAARSGATIVGANVGKNKATPLDAAEGDYARATRELAPYSEFIVLNVSSPNTQDLRALQGVEHLRALVEAVRPELSGRPLLVKLAPDLSDEEVDAIAGLALELGLDGIIATNTTIRRDGLRSPHDFRGGVSGAPLKARSLEVLERLRARVGDRLVLISAGGIETADDAWERILAGATLVQAYTGFIYGGPGWPRRVNRGLAARVRAAGYTSITAAGTRRG
jgi:dihydroorotate dehydrogenase